MGAPAPAAADATPEASRTGSKTWGDQRLRTSGVDTLSLQVAERDGGWVPAVLRESCPHRLLIGAYDMSDGALVERERFGADVSSDVPALLGPRPDVVQLNDDYLTYAKVRLDRESRGRHPAIAGRAAVPAVAVTVV